MRKTRTNHELNQHRGGVAPRAGGLSALSRAVLALVLASLSLMSVGLARPAPAAQAAVTGSSSRFGLVADVGTRYGKYGDQDKPISILAETGAKWVVEEFRWDWVEPRRGVWEWAFMDEAVDAEKARGLDILGKLDYTAGWAVGASGPVSIQPPPLDLWTNYVAKTVERYKDRVHAWEVWNEPNETGQVFWTGTKEQFAQLQAVTYDTIKRVDPSAIVLGPTITGIDEAWLDAMPWDKFDVLALHVYVPAGFLNDQEYSYWNQGLPNLKRVVDAKGGKPIWITEFGYASMNGPQGWYVGGEGEQARYIAQWLAITLAYTGVNIEKVFMYDLNDDERGGGFGLLRNDWSSKKPAFGAYRTAAERLDGAQGRGRFDAGPGAFGYRFARDGKLVDVVWALGSATAVIPSSSDAEVYDLYGNRRTVGRDGNYLRIPVSADPLYVIHDEPRGGDCSQRAEVPGAGLRLFAETGKMVNGIFLNYWQANGGLPIYGYPLTDAIQEQLEDGRTYTVQYFERARFEYHPENPAPYNVLLGQFGRTIHPADPPAAPKAGATYFGETGHNLGGGFRSYWQTHGGLAQFGYPISEEYMETLEDGKGYIVQYFERARFEFHPENPAPYDILLGQFGRAILAQRCR